MSNPEITPAKTTVFGGVKVLAVHRTGSGQPAASVLVKQLPLRQLPELLSSLLESNDAVLVALYTGEKLEWSDTLTEDTIAEILRIGEEINSPFLAGWLARRDARLSRLANLTAAKPDQSPTVGKSGE